MLKMSYKKKSIERHPVCTINMYNVMWHVAAAIHSLSVFSFPVIPFIPSVTWRTCNAERTERMMKMATVAFMATSENRSEFHFHTQCSQDWDWRIF